MKIKKKSLTNIFVFVIIFLFLNTSEIFNDFNMEKQMDGSDGLEN